MRRFKKFFGLLLVVAMMTAMTACTPDTGNEDVTSRADEFVSALTSASEKKLSKICFESEDFFEEFELDIEANAVVAAIASTLEGTVDEESVDASTKDQEGTIDVVFTLVDFEPVIENEDNLVDEETLVAAIEDCEEVTEFEYTLEFTYDEDEDDWYVENYEDVITEIFAFVEVEPEYQVLIAEYVDTTKWVLGYNFIEGNSYSNTDAIELDIQPTSEGMYMDWNIYYTVTFNNEVIYESGYIGLTSYENGAWAEGRFTVDDLSSSASASVYDAFESSYPYLPDGSYTITYYDEFENVIVSDTCQVTNSGASTGTDPVDPSVPTGGDIPSEITELQFIDDTALNGSLVAASWWQYADEMNTAGQYLSDVTNRIEYGLETDGSYTGTIYYEVYYTTTGDLATAETVVEMTACDPVEYTNWFGYEPFYESDAGLAPGYYILIISSDMSSDNVFLCDYVEVI